jgi:hypothetical protein
LAPCARFNIRADRHGVEQTKAHGAVAQGVMARRPHQRESIAALVAGDSVEQTNEAAHRQQTDRERIAASDGVAVQGEAIMARGRFDQLDVIFAMRRFDVSTLSPSCR